MTSLTHLSLATDTEYVQGRLATFVNDLLSLGVDGLRLDAAKRTSCCCYYHCSLLYSLVC